MRRLSLSVALFILGSCQFDPVDPTGKQCDVAGRCPEGLVCVGQVCVGPGDAAMPDAATIVDAGFSSPDASELPSPDATGPGPDAGTMSVDAGPAVGDAASGGMDATPVGQDAGPAVGDAASGGMDATPVGQDAAAAGADAAAAGLDAGPGLDACTPVACAGLTCGQDNGCGHACALGSGCLPVDGGCSPVCVSKTCGAASGCGFSCTAALGCQSSASSCTPQCDDARAGGPDGCGGTCSGTSTVPTCPAVDGGVACGVVPAPDGGIFPCGPLYPLPCPLPLTCGGGGVPHLCGQDPGWPGGVVPDSATRACAHWDAGVGALVFEGVNFCDYSPGGEDGDYLINVPQYTVWRPDGNSPVVVDSVTGLVWDTPTTPPAASQLDAAATFCEQRIVGNLSDWRLPSISELVSIVDYGRPTSVIGPTFQYVAQTLHWSSTPNANAFYSVVDLASGMQIAQAPGYPQTADVLCVRGPTRAAAVIDQLVEDAQSRVHDQATGLVWDPTPRQAMNWFAALTACESSQYAGDVDWRLPCAKEVLSLIDWQSLALGSWGLNPVFFQGLGSHPFMMMTSTLSPVSAAAAPLKYVRSDGFVYNYPLPTGLVSFLCVRGP